MLKQAITMFNSLKNKIIHGSSMKVEVPLSDIYLDLILTFNLKLHNFIMLVFYVYSLFLLAEKIQSSCFSGRKI